MSLRFLNFFVFTGILSGISAKKKVECPSYWSIANESSMTSFDMAKFGPIFYEHFSHDVPVLTSGCECVRYNQTFIDSTTINDEFNCRKVSPKNPDITKFDSTLYLNTNQSEAGKMGEAVIGNDVSQYWVLDTRLTDDQSRYMYALVYACVANPDSLDFFIYYFSISSDPFPASLYSSWNAWMISNGINTDQVIKINQNGCW